MKGVQFEGHTYIAPNPMKSRMAVALTATMTRLAAADSRMPRAMSAVRTPMTRTAGTLRTAPVARQPEAASCAKGGVESAAGMTTPKSLRKLAA
ncbi:MAG: hypothetical protein A4E67_02238 [Syntrophaceae bacterium PtaB.Bin038]|nr:MAG: hypothetical protein A4E67_02238 [Syntrophaceae bacterium PtaB.Bin038]